MQNQSSPWMLQSGDPTNGILCLQTRPSENAGNQSQNMIGFEDICSGVEHLAVNDTEKFPEKIEDVLSGRVDINAKNETGVGFLHIYTARNDLPTVKLLVSSGADVNLKNNKQQTCLHIAAANGFHDIIHLLLENSADPNIGDIDFNTPLMLATEAVDMKAVLILLQAGAHINSISREPNTDFYLFVKSFKGERLSWKPLEDKLNSMDIYDAASKGDDDLMCLLKDLNADFDVRQPGMCYTALHRCAMNGDDKAVKRLVEVGASLEAKDIRGRTPYDIAVVTGNQPTAKYIRSLQVKTSTHV